MDRRMLQKRGRKVEGSKRRRESWIFFCPLGLAILAACLQPFLLTWLHTSAQDPFCYSRKPTETTHSLYSPSGWIQPLLPTPWVTASSGKPLKAATKPCCAVTSKQAFESRKGCRQQPAVILVQARPWEQPHKKTPKRPVFAGLRRSTPQLEGRIALPAGRTISLAVSIKHSSEAADALPCCLQTQKSGDSAGLTLLQCSQRKMPNKAAYVRLCVHTCIFHHCSLCLTLTPPFFFFLHPSLISKIPDTLLFVCWVLYEQYDLHILPQYNLSDNKKNNKCY